MASKENLVATLYGKEDLRLVSSKVPHPDKHDVIVELKACGLCGTDISLLKNGYSGDVVVSPENPFYLGHECSGVVTMTGENVSSLKVGDRVALELGVPCHKCDLCKEGRANLCKGYSQGGFARFHCYPDYMCHKLPDNVTYEEGALMEPLAVSVHACARGNVSLGNHVLICGAGTIGLTTLLTAKAMGAASVCITDVSEQRLKFAYQIGADHTVLVDPGDSTKQTLEKVLSALGQRADCSIECSGAEKSLQVAAHAAKTGGVLVLVALEPEMAKMPLLDTCLRREVDIRGSFSYWGTDYPVALSLLATKKVDVTPLVTHRFPLTRVHDACDLVRRCEPGVMKVIVECDKD